VGDGCFGCHEVFDGRAKLPEGRYLTREEWLFYALRALQDTLERRKDIGLLKVVGDAEERPRKEPKRRARKPPEQRPAKADRKPIPQHVNPWPAKGTRKLSSRVKERANP
jgi:hypothetical protein